MTRHRFVSARLIVAVAAIVCTVAHAASVAPVGGEHGMVVTAHQLATKVGVDVLKRGGNAVDAAVAVGYAMAVVYPAAGNLGGGGFMTIQLADGRKTFLDFREKAPAKATETMYQDAQGNVIPGLSTLGYKAVGVPGSVRGLAYAASHFGKLGFDFAADGGGSGVLYCRAPLDRTGGGTRPHVACGSHMSSNSLGDVVFCHSFF